MEGVYYCGDIHISDAINVERWTRSNDGKGSPPTVVAILLYGSWNARVASLSRDDGVARWVALLNAALAGASSSAHSHHVKITAVSVQVDADEESVDVCVNDEASGGLGAPSDLPALIFLGLPTTATSTASDGKDISRGLRLERVQFKGGPLEALLTRPTSELSSSSEARDTLVSSMGDALSRLVGNRGRILSPPPPNIGRNVGIYNKDKDTTPQLSAPAIRLFVAGDKSQVGKSSCCLGILGALLKCGKYAPEDLAYIKPATQCEQTQLVAEFCKHEGITACVPIGPIVYYPGFTRAFLQGNTAETTEQLLHQAGEAVDGLARNKKVVVIDGVGYPAVGSITGTDNASVAQACGRPFCLPDSSTTSRSPVPVVLIGKPGVGDAVDSFNINATYFIHKRVPVMGAIFNKLNSDPSDFYSLSNCRDAVEMYFRRFRPEMTAFGFIPEMPSLMNASEHVANASEAEQLKQALETANLFVDEFSKHVNVELIVKAAKEATEVNIAEQSSHLPPATLKRPARTDPAQIEKTSYDDTSNAVKKIKRPQPASALDSKHHSSAQGSTGISLNRDQIVAMSLVAGAAGG